MQYKLFSFELILSAEHVLLSICPLEYILKVVYTIFIAVIQSVFVSLCYQQYVHVIQKSLFKSVCRDRNFLIRKSFLCKKSLNGKYSYKNIKSMKYREENMSNDIICQIRLELHVYIMNMCIYTCIYNEYVYIIKRCIE